MAGPRDIKCIYLVLTSQCNLRCSYCFQNDKKAGTMSWEVLKGALDMALASKHEDLKIVFFGGEPLLEFELMERAVDYVDAHCPEGKSVSYATSTNGTLLTPEAVSFLASNWFETQISLDGVPQVQQLRGKHTFNELDALLDRLRREHSAFFRLSVTVNATVLPQTIPYLAESVRYLISKGVHEIEVTPSNTSEALWKREMIDDLALQFGEIYDISRDHFLSTGEIPVRVLRGEVADLLRQPAGRTMCGVMRAETPTIDVDGQVHGCATFADSYQVFPQKFLRESLDSLKIGDFRDQGFVERYEAFPEAARKTGLFHDKQLKYSSYGRCGKCRFLESCSVCPVSIGHIPGNTDPRRVPDFLCAFSLVSLSCRDRFARALPDRFANDFSQEVPDEAVPSAKARLV